MSRALLGSLGEYGTLSAGHTGLGVALERSRGPAVLQLQGCRHWS